PGQDGAINPYYGSASTAIVKNIGVSALNIRIENRIELVKVIKIAAGEVKNIKLASNQQLYFDTDNEAKVTLEFTPIE
ncbi:MAG: hypothetical protein HKN09_03280, partial [Saprospiraceae bacterium]|nr:hypothetical protein [Saprospiraceae bacterium]